MDINNFGECEALAIKEAEDSCDFAMLQIEVSPQVMANLKAAWKDGFMSALARVREGEIVSSKEVRS